MSGKTQLVLFLSIVSLTVLTGCSMTTITAEWKDEAFQEGPLKKTLVIGVSDTPATRRLFEDEFVRELKARGTDAEPSYRFFPTTQKLKKQNVLARIENAAVDSVLITRLVERRTETTYHPGHAYAVPHSYYHNWYDFYSHSYGNAYSPGYVVESEIVSLETNLYDAKAQKLIWTALSDTFVGVSQKRDIRSVIRALAKKLAKQGLIASEKK